MSNIFLKIRGQNGFSISSTQGFELKSTKPLALPTFSGVLYAGSNKSFIGNFDSKTITLAAVLSDYSAKTDVIQWSQVSGAAGSFSSTNTLQTSFTTAANNTVPVVLRITITRTTLNGVVQVSDDLQVDSEPTDVASSVAIASNIKIDTDNLYYNPSWIGSNDQSTEGETDVIYWWIPNKNGGFLERGTADYIGYKVQKFNTTFSQWYDVQTGGAETDTGSYTITDLTGTYRYLPIWNLNGRKIIGNSTKFIKPTMGGSKKGYGVFESVKPILTSNFGLSNQSSGRFATTIETIIATDPVKPSMKTGLTTEVATNRYLSTITNMTETDTLSVKAVNQVLKTNSLNVSRTLGSSIVDLGN